MSYHFHQNSRPGIPLPLDGQDIHAAWCSCSDCQIGRRKAFRLDLLVIALGAGTALVGALVLLLIGVR